jgi:hypothetical protein
LFDKSTIVQSIPEAKEPFQLNEVNIKEKKKKNEVEIVYKERLTIMDSNITKQNLLRTSQLSAQSSKNNS